MAFAVFIFALLLKVSTALSSQNITHLFSAVFIFGDSTADSGKNNYINTPFKADHPPYGEDFPGKIPTGRFSNGKLMSDIWASLLGIKQTVPLFLQPNISDFDIRTGVNFASAGSGHDDMTAQISQMFPPVELEESIKKTGGYPGRFAEPPYHRHSLYKSQKLQLDFVLISLSIQIFTFEPPALGVSMLLNILAGRSIFKSLKYPTINQTYTNYPIMNLKQQGESRNHSWTSCWNQP
ncbi:unnamed protein product [Lactuca saligna]|uniref:GDSL esterase/lipase n=1 Tax=Lactuca saligna TaxID=75948 RepID=A0AA36EC41_LACSI|nr:unnamed protein product [Lactuca saligna]